MHDEECDSISGQCYCDVPGYHGKKCEKKCELGFYGLDCLNLCQCEWDNTRNCNHQSGHCECELGFTGQYCERKCPLGFYGNKCKNSKI